MLYPGIDRHHRPLTISLRGSEGNVIRKRQVSTRPEKMRAFLDDGFMALVWHALWDF